jgi:DNA polymerase-3 subunit alpha
LFAGSEYETAVDPFQNGLPAVEPWTASHLLKLEKEVLGFYYSGHPLNRWGMEVRSFATARAAELGEASDGKDVVLGGIVTSIRGSFDKRGNRIAFVELEDFTGTFEAIVFAEPLARYAENFVPESMLLVGGTLSARDEAEPKLLLDRAIPLSQVVEKIADRVVLDVADPEIDDIFLKRLADIGRRSTGPLKTVLRVGLRNGHLVHVEIPSIRVPASPAVLQELSELVAEGGVRLDGRFAPDRPPRGSEARRSRAPSPA